MRREDGFTAVELMVTVLVMSIVSFMLFNFLDASTNLTSRATLHTRAQQSAELAMRTVTEDLRAANPITAAPCGTYKDCVTFEVQRASQTGRTCEKTVITYTLASGTLRRSLTENTWTGSACAVTRSISNYPLLDSMTNTTATPLLTYYDNKGAALDPASQAATLVKKPSQGGTASVKVTFVVSYKANAPTLTLSSVLALRNNR